MHNKIKFDIGPIFYPVINFYTRRTGSKGSFNLGLRGEAHIYENNRVEFILGVQVSDVAAEEGGMPWTQATVDSVVTVFYKSPLEEKYTLLSELPGALNVFAILFPFLREKVNYCFNSGGISLMLPPQDFVSLIKDEDSFKLIDHRTKELHAEHGR